MQRRIDAVVGLVEPYGCGATLPIPAVVVARHPRVITEYAARGIEFPVHGLSHVDHAALSKHVQLAQLARARTIFEREGLPVTGFRAPYLRWNDATLRAIDENGFIYDGSQAMWCRLGNETMNDAYRRVLDFCGARSADDYPIVPWSEGNVTRIPYVLPDDEAIVERMETTSPERIAERWLQVFTMIHERGELFTLAVHPERIETCGVGVAAVLDAASRASVPVWVTRHEEIARWWRNRSAASVVVAPDRNDQLQVTIKGPVGITVLARGLDIAGANAWTDGYEIVKPTQFDVPARPRPFIGVHRRTPGALSTFLREQGYVVEDSNDARSYAYFVDRPHFARRDRRPLLADIERASFPLLRFGRWPNGSRSALSITGDIDALTLADYLYRIFRR
jgi:peptidoglycan/xylan/chitin deacetylase (PgdA/CDA1 family)